MNAALIVDPIEYQRHPGEPADPPSLLRTLHFGQYHEGLVTFLVYPPEMTSCWSSRFSGSASEFVPILIATFGGFLCGTLHPVAVGVPPCRII